MPRKIRSIAIDVIVSHMISLSKNEDDWNNAGGWRPKGSLWGQLSKLILKSNTDQDRNYFYRNWHTNWKDIQTLFKHSTKLSTNQPKTDGPEWVDEVNSNEEISETEKLEFHKESDNEDNEGYGGATQILSSLEATDKLGSFYDSDKCSTGSLNHSVASYRSRVGSIYDTPVSSMVGEDSGTAGSSRTAAQRKFYEPQSRPTVFEQPQDNGIITLSPDRQSTSDDDQRSNCLDLSDCIHGIEEIGENSQNSVSERNSNHGEEPTKYHTTDVPFLFTIEISNDDWRKYLPEKVDPKPKWEGLKQGWTDMFRKYFAKFNPYCVFNIKRQCLQQYCKPGKSYFTGFGYCSHASCLMFKLTSKRPINKSSPIQILVKSLGKFRHEKGVFHSNKLQFEERKKARDKLRHRKAGPVTTEVHSRADMEVVRLGNRSGIPSKEKMRKVRHEVLKENDLDSDPFYDIIERMKLEHQKKEQFIRYPVANPFQVLFFSDRQLQILSLIRRNFRHCVAHLDATGSLIDTVPNGYGEGPLYVYSLAVTNPLEKSPPLALMEFISIQHKIYSISAALNFYKDLAGAYENLKAGEYLFTRIETDFSLALLNAAILCFLNVSVFDFLNECWEILCGRRTAHGITFHVCRVHIMKALQNNLKKSFKEQSYEYKILLGILRSVILSRSMGTLAFRLQLLFSFCCPVEKLSDVENLIEMSKQLHSEETDKSLWMDLDVPRPAVGRTIYNDSGFGNFVHKLVDKYDSLNQSSEAEGLESLQIPQNSNSFHCPEFIKYLLKTVLPYAPLVTHIMFSFNQDVHEEDHNNPVELWNRIIKHEEHGCSGTMKAGRYIEASRKMMEGKCNQFEMDVMTYLKETDQKPAKRKSFKIPSKELLSESQIAPKIEPNSTSGSNRNFHEIESYQISEFWKRRGFSVGTPSGIIGMFSQLPFIRWGRNVEEITNYDFTNTCTIDNGLMILTAMCEFYPIIQKFFDDKSASSIIAKTIVEIIGHIRVNKINTAKRKWLQNLVLKNVLPKPDINDCWGNLDHYLFAPLIPLLKFHIEIYECPLHGRIASDAISICQYEKGTMKELLHYIHENRSENDVHCLQYPNCKLPAKRRFESITDESMPFLVFYLQNQVSLHDIPRRIKIFNTMYRLFATILNVPGHFISLFPYEKKWIVYDGLSTRFKYANPIPHYQTVPIVWYLKI